MHFRFFDVRFLVVVALCFVITSGILGCESSSYKDDSRSLVPVDPSGMPERRSGENELSRYTSGVKYIRPELYSSIASQLGQPGCVLMPTDHVGTGLGLVFNPNPGYVGAKACAECHAAVVQSSMETAHAKTSSVVDVDATKMLLGVTPKHVRSAVPELNYRIEEFDKKLWQTVIVNRSGQYFAASRSCDLVLGSGNHGQSFLWWQDEALFQLPISYVASVNDFIGSPGYLPSIADYARPIGARCLECHTTWASSESGSSNQFDRQQILFGVTCEKCHGPGAEHVAWHRQHSDEQQAHGIVAPQKLSRERQLDICSLCHAGIGRSDRPPFSFRPGEPLSEFLEIELAGDANGAGGVHTANQAARLRMSRCFQASEMTCTTCHDPHVSETNRGKMFSQRCVSCHQPSHCGEVRRIGVAAESRCIDCHMPKRDDQSTQLLGSQGRFAPQLRDHHIAKWPDATTAVAIELEIMDSDSR